MNSITFKHSIARQVAYGTGLEQADHSRGRTSMTAAELGGPAGDFAKMCRDADSRPVAGGGYT